MMSVVYCRTGFLLFVGLLVLDRGLEHTIQRGRFGGSFGGQGRQE
jgi:hypothetical protein